MRGLREYTHAQRRKVLRKLIPQIRKKFGDNLIALATSASFARNEDFGYSDLELTAFVKRMPGSKKIDGIGKIKDGLKEFINEIRRYKIDNLEEKCIKQVSHKWYEYQEATAKVLNAVIRGDKLGMPLLLYDMILRLLAVLSYLNHTPYVTFSAFIKQAQEFKTKPPGFDDLIDIVVNGEYTNLRNLKKATERVFTECECILDDLGLDFYYDELDFSKPMKSYFR